MLTSTGDALLRQFVGPLTLEQVPDSYWASVFEVVAAITAIFMVRLPYLDLYYSLLRTLMASVKAG